MHLRKSLFAVKSDVLVYKNEILIRIKLCVSFNKCGKFEVNIDDLVSEMVYF